MKRRVGLFLLLCLGLSGCKDKDEARAILPTLDAAFPDSAIFKLDRRLLWVQTHVGGISATTAEQLYLAACAKAIKPIAGRLQINIEEELAFDNKQYLLVGFNSFYIGWDVRSGVDARGIPMHVAVMDKAHLKPWLEERIGYWPSMDQIRVERIQDIQNTPDGEAMQLPTLAELHKAKLERVQQELTQQEQAEGLDN